MNRLLRLALVLALAALSLSPAACQRRPYSASGFVLETLSTNGKTGFPRRLSTWVSTDARGLPAYREAVLVITKRTAIRGVEGGVRSAGAMPNDKVREATREAFVAQVTPRRGDDEVASWLPRAGGLTNEYATWANGVGGDVVFHVPQPDSATVPLSGSVDGIAMSWSSGQQGAALFVLQSESLRYLAVITQDSRIEVGGRLADFDTLMRPADLHGHIEASASRLGQGCVFIRSMRLVTTSD